MNKTARILCGVGLGLFLGGAACEEDGATGGTAAGATMSEPQVAAVLLEVNQGEIAAGEVARIRSTDEAVRTFARRMIDEHEAGNARLRALALALEMDPADSGMRRELADDMHDDMNRLWAVERTGFDRAYLQSQVNMHGRVLTLLDQQLIPSAQAPALKADLMATRAAVALHLQDAQALLAARP
jgi:putative membrane protein